jgi:hypothetical protein
MGIGYTRNDTSNNIADGNIINAADLDGEFDAIESAMGTSGHTHDGTSAEGGPVTVLGPVQDFVASATEIKPKTTNTLDIGTSGLLFKDMFLDGVATIGSIKIDNAGTIGSASDGDAIAISSSGVVTFSQAPVVDVTNATTNAVTDVLDIQVQSTGTPAVGIGSGFTFGVETAAGNVETGGAIRSITTGLTPTAEEIDLVFYSMRNGSLTEGFRYDSSADNFDVTGSISIDGGSTSADFTFGDNNKAIFGAGSDLQIYHDAANSFIEESGTGNLIVAGSTEVKIRNTTGGANLAVFKSGAVDLYASGTKRLETTSTGVNITGTLTADDKINIDASNNSRLNIKETTSTDQNTQFLQSSGDLLIRTLNDAETVATNRIALDHGTGDISFYEDTGTTAKLHWSAADESLGIGTSSPSSKLHISGTYDTILDGNSVQFTRAGPSYIQNNTAGGYTVFQQASGEAMRIDSSGNVGIGTTSPSKKLHISGDRDAILRFENTRTVESGDQILGSLEFYSNDESGTGANVRSRINAFTAGGGNLSYLTFSTADGTTDDVEAMRIDSSGNVGIGLAPSSTGGGYKALQLGLMTNWAFPTTGSAYRSHNLYYDGTNRKYVTTGTAHEYEQSSAGHVFSTAASGTAGTNVTLSEAMRIDSSGNVGIGTSSPDDKLHVTDNIRIEAAFPTLRFKETDTTDQNYQIRLETGSLRFQTNNDAFVAASEAMRIDSSGNLLVRRCP